MILLVNAKISLGLVQTIGIVGNLLRGLIPPKLLIGVIGDKLIDTTSSLLAVQNKVEASLLGLSVVEVEAVARLKSGELWLLILGFGNSGRSFIAINNFEIEGNIAISGNRLTTKG